MVKVVSEDQFDVKLNCISNLNQVCLFLDTKNKNTDTNIREVVLPDYFSLLPHRLIALMHC